MSAFVDAAADEEDHDGGTVEQEIVDLAGMRRELLGHPITFPTGGGGAGGGGAGGGGVGGGMQSNAAEGLGDDSDSADNVPTLNKTASLVQWFIVDVKEEDGNIIVSLKTILGDTRETTYEYASAQVTRQEEAQYIDHDEANVDLYKKLERQHALLKRRSLARASRKELRRTTELNAVTPFLKKLSLFKVKAAFQELIDVVDSDAYYRAVKTYAAKLTTTNEFEEKAMHTFAMFAFTEACHIAGPHAVTLKRNAQAKFTTCCRALWTFANAMLTGRDLGRARAGIKQWRKTYMETFLETELEGELRNQARDFTSSLLEHLAVPASQDALKDLLIPGEIDKVVDPNYTAEEERMLASQNNGRDMMADYLATYSDEYADLARENKLIDHVECCVVARTGNLTDYFDKVAEFYRIDSTEDSKMQTYLKRAAVDCVANGIDSVPVLERGDRQELQKLQKLRATNLQSWKDETIAILKEEVLKTPPEFPSEVIQQGEYEIVQMHTTTSFVLSKLRDALTTDYKVQKISLANITHYHVGALLVLETLLQEGQLKINVPNELMRSRFTRWHAALQTARDLAVTARRNDVSIPRFTLQLYDIIVRAEECKDTIDLNYKKVHAQAIKKGRLYNPSQMTAFQNEMDPQVRQAGLANRDSAIQLIRMNIKTLLGQVKDGRPAAAQSSRDSTLNKLCHELVTQLPIPESAEEAIQVVQWFTDLQSKYGAKESETLKEKLRSLRKKLDKATKAFVLKKLTKPEAVDALTDWYLKIAELRYNDDRLKQAQTHRDNWEILDAREGKGDFHFLVRDAKKDRVNVIEVVQRIITRRDLKAYLYDPETEDIIMTADKIGALTDLDGMLKKEQEAFTTRYEEHQREQAEFQWSSRRIVEDDIDGVGLPDDKMPDGVMSDGDMATWTREQFGLHQPRSPGGDHNPGSAAAAAVGAPNTQESDLDDPDPVHAGRQGLSNSLPGVLPQSEPSSMGGREKRIESSDDGSSDGLSATESDGSDPNGDAAGAHMGSPFEKAGAAVGGAAAAARSPITPQSMSDTSLIGGSPAPNSPPTPVSMSDTSLSGGSLAPNSPPTPESLSGASLSGGSPSPMSTGTPESLSAASRSYDSPAPNSPMSAGTPEPSSGAPGLATTPESLASMSDGLRPYQDIHLIF